MTAPVGAVAHARDWMAGSELQHRVDTAEAHEVAELLVAEVERLTKELAEAKGTLLLAYADRDSARAEVGRLTYELSEERERYAIADRANAAMAAEVERLRGLLERLVDDSEGQQHRLAWQDACEALRGHRGPEATPSALPGEGEVTP